jgi:predicted nucleotidyltransferase
MGEPVEPIRRIPREQARQAAERVATRLREDPRVRLIYLHGSTTDSKQDFVRDVDVAVLTEPALTLDERVRLAADLERTLHVPIDLASLNEASIALAHEVVDNGVCLYAKRPDDETAFVTRARSRYWDFKPFRDAQWRLAGERLAERQRRGAESRRNH